MKVVGVDLSYGSTGLCVLEPVQTDQGVYTRPDDWLRLWSLPTKFWSLPKQHMSWQTAVVIAEQVRDYCFSVDADLVAIEGYSHASRYHSHQMGELGGIVRYVLDEGNLPFDVVPPGVWMKVCTGKGAGSKETLHHAIYKRFGIEHAVGDCVDAFGIAYTAWLSRQPSDRWTGYQAEAYKNWKGKSAAVRA